MLLSDAYKNLTPTAKTQLREELLVLCQERGVQCSRGYLTLLLQGQREHACSAVLARLVSGYVVGMIGLNVTPEDVLASCKSSVV